MNYHTITENAVVLKEEPPSSGKFLLQVAHQGMDNERCATCRMCGDKNGKKVICAVLGEGVDESKIIPGAKVVIELRMPVIYAHIAAVFVLPLIGFFAGVAAGYNLFGAEGIRSIATAGAGAIGAALLYFLGKILLGRKVTQKQDPVIVKVETDQIDSKNF